MKRLALGSVIAILLAAGTETASAQVGAYPGPPSYLRPPVLSPYLNLALGLDPAVNYFLGVRRSVDQRINDRILGNAIRTLDRRVDRATGADDSLFPKLPGTGHSTGFMNYGGYYNMGRPAPRTTGFNPGRLGR